METDRQKVQNLTERIDDVSKQMDELLQIKINLMMLRNKYNMNDVRESLEKSFTPQLKKRLEEKFKDKIDG